ncbi:MAG: ABC transporter permease [Armatimonadota bacterium]
MIRPTSGTGPFDLRELWRYRHLVRAFALRDVKLRYRQTLLGVAWVVLQPLVGAVIFAMFTKVAKVPTGTVPPLLFSFSSLLGWTVFQSVLTKSGNCLLGNSQMVSKIYFPRLVLPLSVVPGALIDLAVSTAVLGAIMAAYRVAPGPALPLAPVFVAGLVLLALAAGMVFSALSVSFRDIQYIVPVLVQFLFWASPVVLPARLYDQGLQWMMVANPVAGLIEGLRWSLLGTPAPSTPALVVGFGGAIVLFLAASAFFHRLERRFADVI